jgi:DNA-binding MarR family transcriptional regulator
VSGLETEFTDAGDSTGLLLWRVTNSWQAAIRAGLAPHGLTHVQFVLLASLAWLGPDAEVTQTALAGFARTDIMMTSQVLRALEAKGLVTRERHPDDGRARIIRATAEGVALANRANRDVERIDREFFGRLGARTADFTAALTALARDDSRPASAAPSAYA